MIRDPIETAEAPSGDAAPNHPTRLGRLSRRTRLGLVAAAVVLAFLCCGRLFGQRQHVRQPPSLARHESRTGGLWTA